MTNGPQVWRHITAVKVPCRKGRHPHGESNARARLTADDVRMMRATYSGRYGEIATFARHYGVDETTIAAIVHRRSWLSVA